MFANTRPQKSSTLSLLHRAIKDYAQKCRYSRISKCLDAGWKCLSTNEFLSSHKETEELKISALGRHTLDILDTYQPLVCLARTIWAAPTMAAFYELKGNAMFLGPEAHIFRLNTTTLHEATHCDQQHQTSGLYSRLLRNKKIGNAVLAAMLLEAGAQTKVNLYTDQMCVGRRHRRDRRKIPPVQIFDERIQETLPNMLNKQVSHIFSEYAALDTRRIKFDFRVAPLTDETIRKLTTGSLYPKDTILKQTKPTIEALRDNIEVLACQSFQQNNI
ncbi:MAG: hypothetical protein PHD48_08370 [Alphaproteobacteria bacterium]|nr:hypothetical protein [Alphaproteobacteria bacterium]